MKFEYDLSDNFFKYINISWYVNLRKKDIIKHPNKKIHGFVFYILRYILFIFLLLFFCYVIKPFFYKLSIILLLISGTLMLLLLGIFAFNYFLLKNNCSRIGTLIVDNNGMLDVDDDITIRYSWDKIDNIFILDDLIVIITNNLMFPLLCANISNHKRFINAVKKYSEETLIVDTTKK